ncbi:spermidine/putrescine transport system permease protein [Hathewaya proteolytica DSM 3090]|uniref:Spermidine/putrescine transport system permease protein n=1 Tax=Hathewaya proteolytica DSM 3090 TaxID=1121331 RepID=A0A1M6J2C4_9CLOT|nr:ABC transporter permease [Hathewaya proteolytica]SHJ40838.1 spermidine/putrescine transport system permease protein [Hathewaya proteolytica DSM 3090]
MVKKYLKASYMVLIYFFLYAPILFLMVYSFNNSKGRMGWSGFTLKWYYELFQDTELMKSLYYTLVLGIMASFFSTVLGTLGAIGIYKTSSFKESLFLNLNYLPVLNADIVTAVSLMLLFNILQIEKGFFTLLLSHITFCTPYVVLAVLPRLKQLPDNTIEAALDLGATPFYTLTKVIIPQIYDGIFSAALISFTLSIDDFVISFFNTGSGVSNLSINIFSMARRGIHPKINALCTLIFLILVMSLFIVNKKMWREK